MKNKLLIAIGMLMGLQCYGAEPKYQYEDHVQFKVPKFYANVCSGNGKIVNLLQEEDQLIYVVHNDDRNTTCPKYYFKVKEVDIKSIIKD